MYPAGTYKKARKIEDKYSRYENSESELSDARHRMHKRKHPVICADYTISDELDLNNLLVINENDELDDDTQPSNIGDLISIDNENTGVVFNDICHQSQTTFKGNYNVCAKSKSNEYLSERIDKLTEETVKLRVIVEDFIQKQHTNVAITIPPEVECNTNIDFEFPVILRENLEDLERRLRSDQIFKNQLVYILYVYIFCFIFELICNLLFS